VYPPSRSVAIAIAPARRLRDGIQPGQVPYYNSEVDVHARLDQLRTDA
jgi:hypothetical protein